MRYLLIFLMALLLFVSDGCKGGGGGHDRNETPPYVPPTP